LNFKIISEIFLEILTQTLCLQKLYLSTTDMSLADLSL
jgi:hypothetical protein